MKIFCFTSDRYLWAVKGYIHQMQKYWLGVESVIVGFTKPDFDLPGNYSFHSIGRFEDYPAERWSDAVIEFLAGVKDELFILMLEDYWITRKVDVETIKFLEWYMINNPDISGIDLTSDRLYGANLRDYESLDRVDLVVNDPPAPYHFSLQARMWRTSEILKYMVPGESPWQLEIRGSERMIKDRAVVLGTRQIPVRYLIAIQNGKVAFDGGYQVPGILMREKDKRELAKLLPAAENV